MEPLLIYIREDYVELFSIDNNGIVLPVNFQSSNKVPLYFILNGDQIEMDDNAKQQYLNCNNNSFGDFWKNIGNKSLTYNRFQKCFTFDTLLPYAMKESILPEVIKSHFHSSNFSEFIQQKRTFLLFDSFVEEDQREIITQGFLEIIGFAPNHLTILDFWELFRSFQKTSEEAILFVNASLGNIYIHLIASKYPYHVSKKVIVGKGRDPRVDTILDFVIEKAIARGSGIAASDLKNIIASEANIILSKLPNGFVQYTIRNNKLDVNPLRLDFNAQELESRLSNKQSINLIQNEFEEFRRNNNAIRLSIYLNGCVINQEVFLEFFRSTYNKVESDNLHSSRQFLEYILNKTKSLCGDKLNTNNVNQLDQLSSPGPKLSHIANEERRIPIIIIPPVAATHLVAQTPSVIATPPVVTPLVVVNTPPVATTPPMVTPPVVVNPPPVATIQPMVTPPVVVNPPPVATIPPMVTPPVVVAPPKVTTPPIVKTQPKIKINSVPPPPPPPPIKKK